MPTLRVRALIAEGDPWNFSCRRVDEVTRLFEGVNEIWRQAGLGFDAEVAEFRFDRSTLADVVQAAHRREPDAARLVEVTGARPREITAIFVHSIGGSNGKVFRPKRTVLVVDNTAMPAARTTAHEIGHIFDLEHWLSRPPPDLPDRPPSHLMARTQSGTQLIPSDIEQVRRRLPELGLDYSKD